MPLPKVPCWVAQLFRNPRSIDLLLRGVVTLGRCLRKLGESGSPSHAAVTHPNIHYLSVIGSTFLPPTLAYSSPLTSDLCICFSLSGILVQTNFSHSKTVLQGGRWMWGSRDNPVTHVKCWWHACWPTSPHLFYGEGLFIK